MIGPAEEPPLDARPRSSPTDYSLEHCTVTRRTPTELLLLTRPYSWLDMVLTALIGMAWNGHPTAPGRQVSTAAVALLAWFSLNWISEYTQRDPGREPPSRLLSTLPLLGAAGWSFFLGGGRALALIGIYAVLAFAYPWKARTRAMGPFGPVIRGAQTALLFLLGESFAPGGRPSGRMVLALVIIQASRSLIADVRDSRTDKYELPKIIGDRWAKAVSIALLILGIAALPAPNPASGAAHVIFIFMLVILIIFTVEWAYEAHLAFIFLTTFAKLAIFTALIGESGHINWIILAPAQLVLGISYWYIPRGSNKTFREHMVRAIRIVSNDARN